MKRATTFWSGVTKGALVATMSILFVPAAARANSMCNSNNYGFHQICIETTGGTLTGSSAGMSVTATVSFQFLMKSGTGSFSLNLGPLVSGNLETGGNFSGGSIHMQLETGSGYSFNGSLGYGTWTVQGLTTNPMGQFVCSSSCTYILTDSLSTDGQFPHGGNITLMFTTRNPYTGGSMAISSGTGSVMLPEPGALSLMGTGLVSLGGLFRRRLQSRLKS